MNCMCVVLEQTLEALALKFSDLRVELGVFRFFQLLACYRFLFVPLDF